MIQVICCECGQSARFEDAGAAIGEAWQRVKFSAPAPLAGKEDWFCPREPRTAISAKLEARVAEGLQVIREGRIVE